MTSGGRKTNKLVRKQDLRLQLMHEAPGVVERLKELVNSKNENIALGAVRVYLAKCLPDMASVEYKAGPQNKFLIALGIPNANDRTRNTGNNITVSEVSPLPAETTRGVD